MRPRLHEFAKRLSEYLVVDIHQSPVDLARSLKEQARSDDQIRSGDGLEDRADKVLSRLSSRSPEYWVDFARQTSSTETKLTRTGIEAGARLMLHGYLACTILLYVVEGIQLPSKFLDEGDFLDLAGRTPTSHEAPTGPIDPAGQTESDPPVAEATEPD